MDFANSHKTKGKTAIACIGSMHSMVEFSSLCINMDTIITDICSNDEPQQILCQILLNFAPIINNPDWVCWSDNIGLMNLLHSYCYSFLKQISTALPTSPLILVMVISCAKPKKYLCSRCKGYLSFMSVLR
jgi:hypothetical protein